MGVIKKTVANPKTNLVKHLIFDIKIRYSTTLVEAAPDFSASQIL